MVAKKQNKKKPRHKFEPFVAKKPSSKEDPNKSDHEFFVWRIYDRYIDYNHPEYGWDKIGTTYFLKEIVQELQGYEGLTWIEVKCKPHCHPWEIDKLQKDLISRLEEREIVVDELFQISFGNKPRLIGYKERKIFYPMWYDPEHNICKTKAK